MGRRSVRSLERANGSDGAEGLEGGPFARLLERRIAAAEEAATLKVVTMSSRIFVQSGWWQCLGLGRVGCWVSWVRVGEGCVGGEKHGVREGMVLEGLLEKGYACGGASF